MNPNSNWSTTNPPRANTQRLSGSNTPTTPNTSNTPSYVAIIPRSIQPEDSNRIRRNLDNKSLEEIRKEYKNFYNRGRNQQRRQGREVKSKHNCKFTTRTASYYQYQPIITPLTFAGYQIPDWSKDEFPGPHGLVMSIYAGSGAGAAIDFIINDYIKGHYINSNGPGAFHSTLGFFYSQLRRFEDANKQTDIALECPDRINFPDRRAITETAKGDMYSELALVSLERGQKNEFKNNLLLALQWFLKANKSRSDYMLTFNSNIEKQKVKNLELRTSLAIQNSVLRVAFEQNIILVLSQKERQLLETQPQLDVGYLRCTVEIDDPHLYRHSNRENNLFPQTLHANYPTVSHSFSISNTNAYSQSQFAYVNPVPVSCVYQQPQPFNINQTRPLTLNQFPPTPLRTINSNQTRPAPSSANVNQTHPPSFPSASQAIQTSPYVNTQTYYSPTFSSFNQTTQTPSTINENQSYPFSIQNQASPSPQFINNYPHFTTTYFNDNQTIHPSVEVNQTAPAPQTHNVHQTIDPAHPSVYANSETYYPAPNWGVCYQPGSQHTAPMHSDMTHSNVTSHVAHTDPYSNRQFAPTFAASSSSSNHSSSSLDDILMDLDFILFTQENSGQE